jgi:hypothetical protein
MAAKYISQHYKQVYTVRGVKQFIDLLTIHSRQPKSRNNLISTTDRLGNGRLGFDSRQTKEIFVSAFYQVTHRDRSEDRRTFIIRAKEYKNNDLLTVKTRGITALRNAKKKKTPVNTALLPRKLFGTYVPRQTVTTISKCKGKGKAIPEHTWASPEGSIRLRIPRFPDIRHTTLLRLSALSTGPRTYSWY